MSRYLPKFVCDEPLKLTNCKKYLFFWPSSKTADLVFTSALREECSIAQKWLIMSASKLVNIHIELLIKKLGPLCDKKIN